MQVREHLVREIKGLGYKEASHFLRNVGKGEDVAIIDRHILRNLVRFKMIKKIPATISREGYIELESAVKKLSKKLGISLSHLDMVLWARETGVIFK